MQGWVLNCMRERLLLLSLLLFLWPFAVCGFVLLAQLFDTIFFFKVFYSLKSFFLILKDLDEIDPTVENFSGLLHRGAQTRSSGVLDVPDVLAPERVGQYIENVCQYGLQTPCSDLAE